MNMVDIREATHVRCDDGKIEKIVSKWGVGEDGRLALPSEGGFGVVTETGRRVDMWQARSYWKIDEPAAGRAEFSVVEFADDGMHSYVVRWLKSRDAVALAHKCCRRAARPDAGVNRVIITDGGDNTVFEWKRGVGVTFPLNFTGGLK